MRQIVVVRLRQQAAKRSRRRVENDQVDLGDQQLWDGTAAEVLRRRAGACALLSTVCAPAAAERGRKGLLTVLLVPCSPLLPPTSPRSRMERSSRQLCAMCSTSFRSARPTCATLLRARRALLCLRPRVLAFCAALVATPIVLAYARSLALSFPSARAQCRILGRGHKADLPLLRHTLLHLCCG